MFELKAVERGGVAAPVHYKKERGFTLIELLLVVTIIGILVALAWPNYVAMKEREHNRDASANLRLIMAAEKIYRMETNQYWVVPVAETKTTTNVNDNLKLALPLPPSEDGNAIWSYKTTSTDDGVSNCCAQADRTTVGGGSARSLYLTNTEDPNKDLSDYAGACPEE